MVYNLGNAYSKLGIFSGLKFYKNLSILKNLFKSSKTFVNPRSFRRIFPNLGVREFFYIHDFTAFFQIKISDLEIKNFFPSKILKQILDLKIFRVQKLNPVKPKKCALKSKSTKNLIWDIFKLRNSGFAENFLPNIRVGKLRTRILTSPNVSEIRKNNYYE